MPGTSSPPGPSPAARARASRCSPAAGRRRAPPCASPSYDVLADHAHHHVLLHVAVVQPRPDPILGPADPEALGGRDRLNVLGDAARPEPAMAVDVEGMNVVAECQDVPLDDVTELGAEGRCVPDERSSV